MYRCSLYWRLSLLICFMTIGFVLATDAEAEIKDEKDYSDVVYAGVSIYTFLTKQSCILFRRK